MKNKNHFNVGDKVFAKVKGFPAWPAKIISKSRNKYRVEFYYGPGETWDDHDIIHFGGYIKFEKIVYYLKNKEKLYRPTDRKYMEAIEQIEEAIKNDGGDGDPEPDLDDSISLLNSTINSADNPVKGKKPVKRKRSVPETTSLEAKMPKKRGRPRKKTQVSGNRGRPRKTAQVSQETTDGKPDVKESETQNKQTSPTKKCTRAIKVKEEAKAEMETELSPAQENEPTKKAKLAEKNEESADEKNKAIDKNGKFVEKKTVKKNKEQANNESEDKEEDKTKICEEKIEVVTEIFLTNNIAYAKMVKESKAYYKEKPVEPREDFKNQVLPVKIPSSEDMGGLKLHLKWPLKFGSEYDRALYDESVANRVLAAKLKVSSGDQKIINDSAAFIKNIEMNAFAIKKSISLKNLETKKVQIDRSKAELELTGLEAKIKDCLGLDKADPREALRYLESLCEIEFDVIMLKKHTHIVEWVSKLRKYVGNIKEWNMSEESLNEFLDWSEKVRAKAESVYSKFKTIGDSKSGNTDQVSVEETISQEPESEEVVENLDTEQASTSDRTITNSPARGVKRKLATKKNEQEDARIKRAFEIMQSCVDRGDSCDVYGEHIAMKLRTYSKTTQNMVQHLFNNILFKADMGQYDQGCSTGS